MTTPVPSTAFVDLEGVLVPEMWPFLADRFALPALRETTRETPDYVALMDKRIAALRQGGIGIQPILTELRRLAPLPGAIDFVRDLKRRGTVVLVSDSFGPMNSDLVGRFDLDRIICHRFLIDGDGMIAGCDPWNGFRGKHLCYDLFPRSGGFAFAVGDALNDVEMLRRATRGVLFRPSAKTRSSAPDLSVATEYGELLAAFDSSYRRHQGGGQEG
ncbi:phosphoserine phosphatase [Azospirillum sp. B510]|uniref:bifunctional phosphoserine phosphatase/homoserine phosphotransferase ThrH n=1 Tax=Azospirillum sp. (strain B510) TaxID=137722 RepID=UPI0001C4C3C2|nr:bifunctional phosphoserine phosphatase/homoserine phosphotransferase ThrH [Azospirillum sp. B510]BAI70951.1 phosphoserine phosphatase [Azospirillum sp. B510]